MDRAVVLALAIPFLGWLCNVLVLMACLHLFARLGYVRSVCLAFAAGLAVVIGLELATLGARHSGAADRLILAVGDLALYACLAYLFFYVVNTGESSIRVRILREIAEARDGISEQALLQAYNERVILVGRLQRLLQGGRVIRHGDRYFLQARGMVLMAWFFQVLKQILLRRSSEFE